MDQHTERILAQLREDRSRLRPKYQHAVDKYEMWLANYDEIVGASNGNPNIISMAFTQKLFAHIGVAESLFPIRLNSSDKVKLFFSRLDVYSKLLFLMTVRYGRSESERKRRELKALIAFLNNNFSQLDQLFIDAVYRRRRRVSDQGNELFNLRSRLVHRGESVYCGVLQSTNEIIYIASPGGRLRIDERYMSLDEAFLRGVCAKARFKVQPPARRVEQLLIEKKALLRKHRVVIQPGTRIVV